MNLTLSNKSRGQIKNNFGQKKTRLGQKIKPRPATKKMPFYMWNGGHWGAPSAGNFICPKGMYVVGLTGTADGPHVTCVDGILCQTVAQIAAKSPTVTRVQGGGTWRGYRWETRCPPGEAVVGVDGKCWGHVIWLRLWSGDVFGLRKHALSVVGQYESGREYNNNQFGANELMTGISLRWQADIRVFCIFTDNATTDILQAARTAPLADARSCLGLDATILTGTKLPQAACTQMLSQFCVSSATNLALCGNTSFCQGAGKAYCDAAYAILCAAVNNNPNASDSDKKACACSAQNSALANVPGYIPSCHNSDCFKPTAYHTQEMQETTCPPLVVCEQNLVLTDFNKATLSGINMVNDCSGSISKSTNSTIVRQPGMGPNNVPPQPPALLTPPTTATMGAVSLVPSQPLPSHPKQTIASRAPRIVSVPVNDNGPIKSPPPQQLPPQQLPPQQLPPPSAAPSDGINPLIVYGGLAALAAGLGTVLAMRSARASKST